MARHSRASVSMTALALLLAAAAAPRAGASGFQLRDQSGSGQGSAYAGISAGGSDISSMFFNPATLTRFSGNQLQFGLTFIQPTSKLEGAAASRSAVNTVNGFGTPVAIASTPINDGPSNTGNIAKSATLPTLYAMCSVSEDLKLGLSVNVPFGLTTEYDPNWIGRYQAVKSHLETLDITPTVAYRVDQQWSFGAAFVARRAKAELSQRLDLDSTAQIGVAFANRASVVPLPPPSLATDGSATIQGSSWAYGYKLGVLFEPSETLHIGLGYQSRIRETLKGDATFSIPASVAGVVQNFALSGDPNLMGLASNFGKGTADGPVSAVLRLPATLSLGVSYDVSSTFSLAAELAQTNWSTFKELRVKFANNVGNSQPDSVTTENWKDALFVSLGATCHPGTAWTYRAGLALDKTPVTAGYRTPRIPDADRTWLSLGASYQFTPAFGVDAGYSHLFCKDSTVDLTSGNDPLSPNFTRGNLSGTYKNSIDILALQARYSF